MKMIKTTKTMKAIKPISAEDALKVKRPVLGENIPIALWRLLRLVAMPKAFGKDAEVLTRKLGLEMGALLNVKKPEDIIDAINNAQIGICNPLEKEKGFYAIEFTECFTCSGIKPAIGRAICDFEVALIEGAFQKMKMNVSAIEETKCMGGLGDQVCRVEVQTK